MKIYPNFTAAIATARQRLIDVGKWVQGDQWQSRDVKSKPEMVMRETLFFSFQVGVMGESLRALREDIRPNAPWVDDHFIERVSGKGLNPGEQWKHWPWGLSADTFRDKDGRFSHTYMERLWPNNCEDPNATPEGIRYGYGDLGSVVRHMQAHPLTRQAYMPIWHPEDTGVMHGERVPCTIGYHFIMRDNYLHTTYQIRSCDVVRHFQDDIYLAVRLKLWLLENLRELDPSWKAISPGFLIMHVGSLHAFKHDLSKHVKDGKWHE